MVAIGTVRSPLRQGQLTSVHLLQPVPEHGPVDLLEQAERDADLVVRRHPEHVLVVGGVVDLAQGQAVVHRRGAELVPVRDDVRGVEQGPVLELADRAPRLVRDEHAGAERGLVQALLRETAGVLPLRLGQVGGVVDEAERLVQRDEELPVLRLVDQLTIESVDPNDAGLRMPRE